MRLLPLLALLTIAPVPAFADGLELVERDGSPAIVGEGASRTGVELLDGSVGAAIGGEGAIEARSASGAVDAAGQVYVEIGGRRVAVSGTAPAATPAGGAGPATAPDSHTAAEQGAAADCAGATPMPGLLSPSEIAELSDVDAWFVTRICAEADNATIASAIEANLGLRARLSAGGHAAADVVGIRLLPEGGLILIAR